MSTDPRSTRSNEILNALLDEPKKLGKENSQHKPTLEDEELEKLKSTDALSHNNPLSLLANVWFHIVFYFCRRGRERQRELQKSSHKLEVDGSRRNYVTMAYDEVSKNHSGGLKDTRSTENIHKCMKWTVQTMEIKLWSSIFPNSTLKVLHFSSNPAETGRLPIPCRTTARRTASMILTTWWKKLVKQLSCQEFTPTTRSVPQQSPSGRMLKSVTAISWRFPAHYNSRPSTISFCTAAKSFPAVSKGPRH